MCKWIWIIAVLSNCYSSETFSRIPIHSFPFLSDQRFAEIQIDGKQYLGLIDTGSALSMARKDVLEQMANKNFVSNSEYVSINGGKYLTPNFQIPEVMFGHFSFETIFKEEDNNFWTDGCTVGGFSFIRSYKIYLMYQVYREAVIGIDLFQKFACIFDFPHSSIFIAKRISSLMENANGYCAIPFEMGKAGVVITFKTDLGEKRFLLDSAATMSLIRISNDATYLRSKLSVADMDFGCWEFRIMNFSSEFDDIDGVLGIDFFKRNIIGLDFETKTAYIQCPMLGSKERFTYWMKSYFGK